MCTLPLTDLLRWSQDMFPFKKEGFCFVPQIKQTLDEQELEENYPLTLRT